MPLESCFLNHMDLYNVNKKFHDLYLLFVKC